MTLGRSSREGKPICRHYLAAPGRTTMNGKARGCLTCDEKIPRCGYYIDIVHGGANVLERLISKGWNS